MEIKEKSIELLKGYYICNRCFGRQFSQLLSGLNNEQRGRTIRNFIAFLIDSGEKIEVNPINFYGFKFKHNKKFFKKIKKPEKCWVCKGIFERLDDIVEKAKKELKKIEFNNLLVGSKLSKGLLEREEKIWEISGIEWCEPLRAEINREVGKRLEGFFRKPVEFKRPDVVVLVNLEKGKVDLQINSLYIFGYYKKLARGIPQCKWGTPGKYKTSIQEIIAKSIMKTTKGKNNSFHGSGREDVDARCLDWRPFVIEIIEPKKRNINLKNIKKLINKNKKVNVKGLKFSNKNVVRRIKTETGDKTYRILVKLNKPIEKSDLKKLKNLIGIISQRTPNRVVHRRADLIRRRKVKSVKWKQLNRKTIELKIKTSAGLYIKELVTGDKERTKPSVAEILDVEAIPKDLDVIRIEKPKNL